MKKPLQNTGFVNPSRRQFVKGLAASGLVAGLAPEALFAAPTVSSAPILKGNTFDLTLSETPVNLTGRRRMATTINGSLPGPTLRMKEGDRITIRVTNKMSVTSSIHWHGLILPVAMDGVPGLSFAGIKPGETFTYGFDAVQSGTYWYHSHSGYQEQTGLYGSIIIDPRETDPVQYDRDHIVLLSDWSDESPDQIYAKLKKLSHYYNTRERVLGDLTKEAAKVGFQKAVEGREMWNEMRMMPTDFTDLSAHTFTYLMNGTNPASNWTGLFSKGDKVRLRFINGSAQTIFDVRIPGLDMTVVMVDGKLVKPVKFHEFRIGIAETYDVLVTPRADKAFPIFAESMDRSGYTRGTLAPEVGMSAAVPPLRKRPVRTLESIGMGGMDSTVFGGGMDHTK